MPTLPTTSTGTPAVRCRWPSSSVVVVLPLVPVTAMTSLGTQRQASSSSPRTGRPRSRAAAITGAVGGTPGDLTTARTRSSSATPSTPAWTSTAAGISSRPLRRSRGAESTRSPRCRARAAAPRRRAPSGRGRRSGTDRAGAAGAGDMRRGTVVLRANRAPSRGMAARLRRTLAILLVVARRRHRDGRRALARPGRAPAVGRDHRHRDLALPPRGARRLRAAGRLGRALRRRAAAGAADRRGPVGRPRRGRDAGARPSAGRRQRARRGARRGRVGDQAAAADRAGRGRRARRADRGGGAVGAAARVACACAGAG